MDCNSTAGRWVGSLAPELGLVGVVDPEDFRRVLVAYHPHTDQVLVRHGSGSRPAAEAHLRYCLASRLGVEFGPVINGTAEADGVSRELVRHFSRRRRETEAAMAEAGTSSARLAQVATLHTRHAKDYTVDLDTLCDRWRSEAEQFGVAAESIADCLDRARVNDQHWHG